MDKQQFEQVLRQMQCVTMGTSEWPYVTLYSSADLVVPPFNDRFASTGYHYRGISYVQWIQQRISYFRVPDGFHAISCKFSGCAMAKFKLRNKWYVVHIHTDQDSKRDCKTVWDLFCRQYIKDGILSDIHIFKPYVEPIKDQYLRVMNISNWKAATVCGVITSSNECYSCVLDVENYRFVDHTDWVSVPEFPTPFLS